MTILQDFSSKASQKLCALAGVPKYITLPKRRLLMSSHITSHFNYCPLVWMIHNRKLNEKMNKIHGRALRMAYVNHKTSFLKLLNIDKSVTMHKKSCIIYLLKSIKLKKRISPTIVSEIFQFFENPVMNSKLVSIYQPETPVQFSSVLNP